MSEWQPISTAPRNGTEILLYSAAIGVAFGQWVEDIPGHGGPWGDTYGRWDLRDDEQPTHWMPLPPPPEAP